MPRSRRADVDRARRLVPTLVAATFASIALGCGAERRVDGAADASQAEASSGIAPCVRALVEVSGSLAAAYRNWDETLVVLRDERVICIGRDNRLRAVHVPVSSSRVDVVVSFPKPLFLSIERPAGQDPVFSAFEKAAPYTEYAPVAPLALSDEEVTREWLRLESDAESALASIPATGARLDANAATFPRDEHVARGVFGFWKSASAAFDACDASESAKLRKAARDARRPCAPDSLRRDRH